MQKYRIMSLNVNDFGGKVYHLQEYKYFNKNFLFVFSYIYASDEMIKDAIIYMQNKQLDKQRQFNKVFVLVPGHLYCLNLYEGNYEVKRIEFIHQSSQADRARELVEVYEKNHRY